MEPDASIDLVGMDAALLDAYWQHNLHRSDLQETVQAFVPKMMLLTLGASRQPASAWTWTRGVWTAFPETSHVLMYRPESGMLWWKKPAVFSIAETPDVLRALKQGGAIDQRDGGLWLPSEAASSESEAARHFDLVETSLSKPLIPDDCQLFDGVTGVVDADVLSELSAGIAKH